MMKQIGKLGVLAALVGLYAWLVNWLSYRVLKTRVLNRQKWDLNICCGATDGGGVNVDIVAHEPVPNFVQVDDVCRLPFRDDQFETVLCSHTMEHVEDPQEFYQELRRVGKRVTLLTPPLWDISAALNPLEHKWIFWSLETEHQELPAHSRLPFAALIHRWFGQKLDY
jgi:SAM-dependent methyltransferase